MHPTSTQPSRASRLIGVLIAVAAIPASIPLFGCDTAVFAASSTVTVIRRASPALARLRDPELAEEAIPGSIGTMEGLMELVPGDMNLRAVLARSYVSYGYGFLEDRMERAELEGGSEEDIEHWRTRASLAYMRAREVTIGGLDQIHGEDGGIMGAQSRGLEAFQQHLARFTDRERDAPLLLFATYSWARYIGLHRDDMTAIADLAFVTAMSERVLALDETVLNYAPIALHAGLIGSAPAQLGGRPADARTELERAIQLSERKNLMYLVTEAQICAIALQDRALFRSLLEEVINADPNIDPDQRLSNILAQRRAARLLGQIDMYFEPEGTDSSSADGETSGGEGAVE